MRGARGGEETENRTYGDQSKGGGSKERKRERERTYGLGEMTSKGDEGPGELHASITFEIASAHGVVDTHEMERLDRDDGGFFQDGLEGECSASELMKVMSLGRGGMRLDEGADGKDEEEEGEVMGPIVEMLWVRIGGLLAVDEGEGVLLELRFCDTTENPIDLVKVSVDEGLSTFPWGEMGEDEMEDVGGRADGGEGEGVRKESEIWERVSGVSRVGEVSRGPWCSKEKGLGQV